jgi:hypothetical protein
MTPQDFTALHGKTILIKSTADAGRNPQVGLRGTLRVVPRHDDPHQQQVEIDFTFPDMFQRKAGEKALVLDEAEVRRLIASRDDPLEWTIDEPLESLAGTR